MRDVLSAEPRQTCGCKQSFAKLEDVRPQEWPRRMLDLGGDEPDAGGRQVEWCRAVQPPTAGEEPLELSEVGWGDGLGGGDREPELRAGRSGPTTAALIAHRTRHLDEVGRAPHVGDAVPASRDRDGGQPVRVEREEPDPAPSVRPSHKVRTFTSANREIQGSAGKPGARTESRNAMSPIHAAPSKVSISRPRGRTRRTTPGSQGRWRKLRRSQRCTMTARSIRSGAAVARS